MSRREYPSGAVLPEGVKLERSELGGKAVYLRGELVGWLHSNGDQWNTYRRIPGSPTGQKLGTFPIEQAVAWILDATGGRP